MDKELKIVALPVRDGKLKPNSLYKSIRDFFGIWLNHDFM
jgi:hypothetical protein